MQFKYLAAASIAALTLGVSASASATIINFDQANAQSPTGSISYDGEGGALTGSGISFDQISMNQGTLPAGHDDTLSCMSCTIEFTTGANIAENITGGIWQFGTGGQLTMSGEVYDSAGTLITDGVLFTGGFTSAYVFGYGGDSLNASLSGADDFNETLAGYFGVIPGTDFDFSSTQIALGSATFGDNGSFQSDLLSNADVTVQSTTRDVPEPSQFGLFGLGLALMAGGLGFRRKNSGSNA
ncbi:PEP-CTERM sorting domain-containing protein [Salinisphaera sp. SPP-AMP-43]|uniref:PEP-CTERM sorting domain-containing protein n=1 Tax=Salinisphaera sp. SPP-AMP-43 TaxID=3121288 RepID=UPI003C6DD67F